MTYTNKNWGKGNRLTRKKEKLANKRAIKKGIRNLSRGLNRKTEHNNPIKGAVPVKQYYRDIKEIMDYKKAQEYFNDFSDSFSRRSSSNRRRSSSRRRMSSSNRRRMSSSNRRRMSSRNSS